MEARPQSEDYAKHVEHPRYGKMPRFTGLDPNPNSSAVRLHWNTGFLTEGQLRGIEKLIGWRPTFPSDGTKMVHGTAVEANLARQSPATLAVTHYYDLDKVCRDCGGRFIFFAEEQKHWYEEIGFSLEADAVRCPPCRKRLQHIARIRERYEHLFHVPSRSLDETFEMADCSLTLIEEAVFNPRQIERVRMLLNDVPCDRQSDQRHLALTARVMAFTSNPGSESGPRSS